MPHTIYNSRTIWIIKTLVLYVDFFGRNFLEGLKPAVKNFISKELSVYLVKFSREMKKVELLYEGIIKDMSIEDAYETLELIENIVINTFKVRNRIKSIQEEKVEVLRCLFFNPEYFYFVDVETGLNKGQDAGRLWLIGIANGQIEEIKQIFYPKESYQFFKYLEDNYVKTLVSWIDFDHKVLKPILESENI